MQIMPVTARAVGAGAGIAAYPGENLAIGQRFMMLLAADEDIDGDLIRLLAGYGQGLYALKCSGLAASRTPAIPSAVPRSHPKSKDPDLLSKKPSAHSWHYAALLHLPSSSLDALAAGRYPRLVRADALGKSVGGCGRQAAAR